MKLKNKTYFKKLSQEYLIRELNDACSNGHLNIYLPL
jgi:hypothetical protein